MKKEYYLYKLKLSSLNFISIILLIIMMLLTFIIVRLFNISITIEISNINIGIVCITYIIYIIFHELLHSLSYILHGAKFKNITYGAHLEKGILCCLCKQNITKKNILNSLLFPLFYLGLITYVIGLIISSPLLIILSILNISGCSGDIIMFIYFIKLRNFEYTELDDPISFALYTSDNISQNKPYGLKYIGHAENVERNDLKKLSVSKISFLLLILLIIMSLVLIFVKR